MCGIGKVVELLLQIGRMALSRDPSVGRPRAQHLSLARASDGPVGPSGRHGGSVGRDSAVGGSSLRARSRGDLELGHVDDSLAASVATGTASLGLGLVVGGDVERDEQEQVGAKDAHAGEGGELLSGANTHVGQLGEVGRGEVGVGRKVHEACTNQHVTVVVARQGFTYQDR